MRGNLSEFVVFGAIVGGLAAGAKRGVLGDTAALHGLPVVVHEIAVLCRVVQFPGPRVFVLDAVSGV